VELAGTPLQEFAPAYCISMINVLKVGLPIPKTISLEGGRITGDEDIYTENGVVISAAVPNDPNEAPSIRTEPDPHVRFMTVVWRLMQQSLTLVNQEEAPRPMARQSKRLDLVPLVTVIQLRQVKHAHKGEGAEIEWSHRWLRRGHWRRQWYRDGDALVQKSIYIHQTICGPDDKPLIIKDHVTALMR